MGIHIGDIVMITSYNKSYPEIRSNLGAVLQVVRLVKHGFLFDREWQLKSLTRISGISKQTGQIEMAARGTLVTISEKFITVMNKSEAKDETLEYSGYPPSPDDPEIFLKAIHRNQQMWGSGAILSNAAIDKFLGMHSTSRLYRPQGPRI